MIARILMCAVCLALAAGCSKRPKFTGSSDGPSSESHAAASPDKGKPGDKPKEGKDAAPNWLTDPRFQKSREKSSGEGTDAGGLPGKPGWGLGKPDGGWVRNNSAPSGASSGAPSRPATPPGAFPGGAQAGGGNAVAPRPVTEADLKDVGTFIDNSSGASGQMPSPQQVLGALMAAKSPAAELVRDGSIILTGSRARDSVWAYEKAALTQGGWVVSQNGTERLAAAELNARLR